jgi:DNA-binding MarR family transcriptional regulator
VPEVSRVSQHDVLQAIPSDKWVPPKAIREKVNTSPTSLYQMLHRLLDKGKVERKPHLPDMRMKLYRRKVS